MDAVQPPYPYLSAEQYTKITKLSAGLPAFTDVVSRLGSADMQAWLAADCPEVDVPPLWDVTAKLTDVGIALHKLLLIQVTNSYTNYCLYQSLTPTL